MTGKTAVLDFRKLQAGIAPLASVVTFVFGIIGTFIGIALPIFNSPNQSTVAAYTICIMFALFVLWSVVREYRIARKEKYANISYKLQSVSEKVRELSLKLHLASLPTAKGDEETLASVTEKLGLILDDVATIFSILTGTRCRATIKVIATDGTEFWCPVLARDSYSASQNANSDRERANRRIDVIQKNIDFRLLSDPKQDDQGYYFNNNLAQGNYESTSIQYHYDQVGRSSHLWRPGTAESWPLSYRSAVVWPIRQTATPFFTKVRCLGFLAVDSESRNVFEERWDSSLGASMANMLFLPLLLYQQIEQRVRLTQSVSKNVEKTDG
jgi:hypothetical protein